MKNLIFVIMFIVLLLLLLLKSTLPTKSTIERKSDFDKDKFLVLLFPVEENELCKRAVIASLTEFEQDFIQVYQNGDVVMNIPKEKFTIFPSPKYDLYVKRLNEEFNNWGEKTDWILAEYTFKNTNQKTNVIFKLKDKCGGAKTHYYTINNKLVYPTKMKTEVDIAKKLAN